MPGTEQEWELCGRLQVEKTSVDSCLLSDHHLIYSAFLMHNRQLLASMALQAYPVNREAQNILH